MIRMIFCLWMGLTCCYLNAREDSTSKPNIILIMADDLGYGDLGCYGQKIIKTPEIDAMARNGMRFLQYYSGSTVCAPSRNALLTGRHTGHTFVRGNFNPDGDEDLTIPLTDKTMAEYLRKAGYQTAIIGKWGLGRSGLGPNHQGFDYSFGYLNQIEAHSYYPEVLWENEEKVLLPENSDGRKQAYSHDLFVSEAVTYISNQKKEDPFFLYLPLTPPHGKYEVPDDAPYSKESWSQRDKNLAAMITRLDGDVGRILQAVEEAGLAENTLVLFTSDNGAGDVADELFDRNGVLKGFKRDLYEGGIRVPMIAWWPGTIAPGQVTEQVMAAWDVLPGLAELAGVSVDKVVDGISMVPTWTGKGEQRDHEYLYWEYYTYNWQWDKPGNSKPRNWLSSRAIRMGPWKIIQNNIESGTPSMELYNLESDRCETMDVASQHPEILVRASGLFKTAGKQSSPYFPYQAYQSSKDPKTPFNFKNGKELMKFLHPVGHRILITSHRGDKMGGFGENSIACFSKTLEQAPVMFETDPRYTKDSVVILFHDPDLDRTSNGTGKVSDFTWEELQKLHLKDPYGNITPYRIPTLDEALEWARGKTILFLDNKDVPVEVRARKILEHHATGYAVVMAYNLEDARKVYDISPDIMIQVFIPDQEALDKLRTIGIPFDNVVGFVSHQWPENDQHLQKLHDLGILTILGSSRTIDQPYLQGRIDTGESAAQYRQLAELGPGIIEADCGIEAYRAVED